MISSHDGPLVIYFLQHGYLFYDHDLLDDDEKRMMWSLDINVLERSVQCFLFNRALQVF